MVIYNHIANLMINFVGATVRLMKGKIGVNAGTVVAMMPFLLVGKQNLS